MGSSLILQGGAAVAKTLQETITQTGHGFAEGDVLRWSNTLNAYTKAQANTALNAEVAGVVSEYIDENTFKITYHGYIEIAAFSARTDPVMFLSADTAGGLTGAPPSAVGTVVKPVLTKNTNSTGYLVMNYLGTQIGGSSTVAVDEIQPVGTIMPFAGTVIPDTWLECDGGSYGITDYPELYEKLLYADGERAPLYGYVVELGMNNSASGYYSNLAVGNILLFSGSGTPTATSYDAAGLVVSKTAPSIASPGAYPVTVKILPKYDSGTKKFQFPNFVVTTNTGIVAFTDYTLATKVTGSVNAHSSNSISINKFLTPDLRGRFLLGVNPTAIGETEGDTTFISSTGQYTMASIGGEELHTLTTGEMPAHNHSASTNSTGAHTHTAQSAGAHRHKLFADTALSNDAAAQVTATGFAAVTLQESGAPLNYDIKNTTVSASLGQSSAEGDHTHTTDSQGSHSHTVTVGNSGSNTAHNNMPPYLAVRYIIKAKPYTRAAIIDGIDLPYNSLLVRDLRTRNVGGSNASLSLYTNTSGDSGNGTERVRVSGVDGAVHINPFDFPNSTAEGTIDRYAAGQSTLIVGSTAGTRYGPLMAVSRDQNLTAGVTLAAFWALNSAGDPSDSPAGTRRPRLWIRANSEGIVLHESYNHGANNLMFEVGGQGNEIMRLSANKSVGIGNSTLNARLCVGSGEYDSQKDYCANFTSDSNDGGWGGIVFSQNSTNGFKMWTQGTGNSTTGNNLLRISLIRISDGAYLDGRTETSPHFELSGAGTLKLNGTLVSTSDARVKTDIVTVDGALEKVLNMNGVYYRRTDTQSDKRCVGVIAQNVREHLPEVVEESNDGMLSVSYGNMVGVLLEAIKELHSKVESQSKEISELRNRIQ
jgi:microcystin-dependent protein